MPHAPLRSWVALAATPLLLCACLMPPAATVPMRSRLHAATSGSADRLVVMLPGRGDGFGTYERNGFVARAQALDPDLDVIEADAHLGYYYAKSISARLHEDVIAPVHDRYEQVWLVGISMGGFGSMIYAQDHPGVVDGILALAPWMGSEQVAADVRRAGLRDWQPKAEHAPVEGAEPTLEQRSSQLWRFLQQRVAKPDAAPRLVVGYGAQDSFARHIRLFADLLPKGRTLSRRGGHRWTVWRPLFTELSQRVFGDGAED